VLGQGQPATAAVGGPKVNPAASDVIAALNLVPHPEGGHYAETWRGERTANGRAVGSAIYYLLAAGERSHWHRVDAAEVWLWHAGAPLDLLIGRSALVLGPDVLAGERPQAVVPPGAWQAAESTGARTLVSCVVAPGFEFAGFELGEPGFEPPG